MSPYNRKRNVVKNIFMIGSLAGVVCLSCVPALADNGGEFPGRRQGGGTWSRVPAIHTVLPLN